MASIIAIGDKWRAQVRRKGHPQRTETFETKALATTWGRRIEAEIDALKANGAQPGIRGVTLSEVFDLALAEKNVGKTKRNVLEHLREGIGMILNDHLQPKDIVDYIKTRGYGPATAQQELSILVTTLNLANLAWGYYIPIGVMERARAALKAAKMISKSKERDRRPTEEELDRLCDWFDEHSVFPMRDIIWFSIYTTMRASEVAKLRWDTYYPNDKTILIKERKHPRFKEDLIVPLLDEAIEIIERQPRDSEFIFPYRHRTFSSIFPRACNYLEPKIKDLRWHDLRHEGASRLFERGYQIHEVAMFTGHRDWKQLKRYTNLKAKNIRRL